MGTGHTAKEKRARIKEAENALREVLRRLYKDRGDELTDKLLVKYGSPGAVLEAGKRVDVLSGARKAQAFSMLIRTMAPQALACDEIGRMEDVDAVLDAVRCGAGVLATAHADGFDDAMARPAIRRLLDARAFERYVLLGACGSVRGVWNERGEWLFSKEGANRGDVGRGGDGDDSGKCNRLLAL